MMKHITAVAIFCLLGLGSLTPVRAQEIVPAQVIDPAQLTGLWTLQTIDGSEPPMVITLAIRADGTMVSNEGGNYDEGTWRLDSTPEGSVFAIRPVPDMEVPFALTMPDEATFQLVSEEGSVIIWTMGESQPEPEIPNPPEPTELSPECRALLESLVPGGSVHPLDWARLTYEGCPELSPTILCSRAVERLALAPPENQLQIVANDCFIPMCPQTFEAFASPDLEPAQRVPHLRSQCGPIIGSDLLSDEETAQRFDASSLSTVAPDSEEYYEALASLDFTTWFLSEMLYSRAARLADEERLLVRTVLRGTVLFEEAE